MLNNKKVIIAIAKKDALFPQNWDEQNYFDEKDNFDVFFAGVLSEEELDNKFNEAIHFAINNYGSGESFRPVFVFDGDGGYLRIEGSSNVKLVTIK